jgi:hypothetical protein
VEINRLQKFRAGSENTTQQKLQRKRRQTVQKTALILRTIAIRQRRRDVEIGEMGNPGEMLKSGKC